MKKVAVFVILERWTCEEEVNKCWAAQYPLSSCNIAV